MPESQARKPKKRVKRLNKMQDQPKHKKNLQSTVS